MTTAALTAPSSCPTFPMQLDVSPRGTSSLTSTFAFCCSSIAGLGVVASHSSEPGSSTSSFVRMGNSNSQRATIAAAQGSTKAAEVQTHKLFAQSGSPLTMTFLEGNTWLWEVLGLRILIDPVLVGNLDFGIPMLYDGAKKTFSNFKLENLPELDYLLICQGYDDHCHEKTIEPLSRLMPNLPVIASPNARKILSKYFKKVKYLEPTGESTTVEARNGSKVVIRATPGPILGPPWQRPENGYFIQAKEPKFTIYYEPHCIYENANLEQERADVIVTPVIKQVLPAYTLVSGQEDAVKVAEWLRPKYMDSPALYVSCSQFQHL